MSGYWIGAIVTGLLLPWFLSAEGLIRHGRIIEALGLWAGPTILTIPFALFLFWLVRRVIG